MKIDPDGRDALAVTFVGYRIETPFGKQPAGHSGITISKGGRTKYVEFGRYIPGGQVNYRGPLPDFKLGKNGLPTEASLKNYARALTKLRGQKKPVEGAYFVNDRPDDMLKFVKDREKDPAKQGTYNLALNNCATFCEDVLRAGGEKLDFSFINTPSNIIQQLQDRADFYFSYFYDSDQLEVNCNGQTCPE